MKTSEQLQEDYSRFCDRVFDEGLEYTIQHYSDWVEEFEEASPALYAKIVKAQMALNELGNAVEMIRQTIRWEE
jgi:hypothetical protein